MQTTSIWASLLPSIFQAGGSIGLNLLNQSAAEKEAAYKTELAKLGLESEENRLILAKIQASATQTQAEQQSKQLITIAGIAVIGLVLIVLISKRA